MQKYVSEDYCGGIKNWRLAIVHYVAVALGLLIDVSGFPLGTSRNVTLSKVQEGK